MKSLQRNTSEDTFRLSMVSQGAGHLAHEIRLEAVDVRLQAADRSGQSLLLSEVSTQVDDLSVLSLQQLQHLAHARLQLSMKIKVSINGLI